MEVLNEIEVKPFYTSDFRVLNYTDVDQDALEDYESGVILILTDRQGNARAFQIPELQ